MPSYKLYYFNIRARGEVARILMAYGGIEYEEINYTWAEWAKIKPTTPIGALPILEVDGHKFCQSHAIGRFLAKKVGLHGKSDLDEIKIDMVIGCMEDLFIKLMPGIMLEKDEAKKQEMIKAFEDSLEKNLKSIEALIEDDYCTGNQLSWADISIAEGLMFPAAALGIKIPMDKVPKLAALQDRVFNHPKIAPYIAKRPESKF